MTDKDISVIWPNFWDDIMLFDFAKDPFFSNYETMKVNSEENQYTFQTDLPGFSKEQINVNVKEGFLEITAKQEEKTKTSFSRKDFSQRYRLPKDIDLEQDSKPAKYENGVLELVFSKKQIPEKSDEKQIKIE